MLYRARRFALPGLLLAVGVASTASAQGSAAPDRPAAPALASPVCEQPSAPDPPADARAQSASEPKPSRDASAPTAAATERVAAPDIRSVRFMANDAERLALYVRAGGTWQSLCTSPCSFTPPEGPADYAAPPQTLDARLRVSARDLWLVEGDGLQATFRDRSYVRKVGAVLAGLGALAFVPVIATGPDKQTVAGVGTALGAIVVSGVIMLAMPDRMKLTRCIGCNPARRGPSASR
ncbi:MAG TPA: hypothetical protein VG963_07390 [Polyangiaceae bacterium]|nr:hypothetical protein [Polyangiaceae bacterium]